MGILDYAIADTPIAVFDFETTGLDPIDDRVVEVSVIRREPSGATSLVLDTLVNPCGPVGATEIHGITDEDVADAPIFAEIADQLVSAVSGCVLAAHNVYFDMRFLESELSRLGRYAPPPHFCLMYLRPMLAIGQRCSLTDACAHHGIQHATAHTASADARAATQLLELYLEQATARGVITFRDLASLRNYKFTQSFVFDPFCAPSGREHPRSRHALKSRTGGPMRETPGDVDHESGRTGRIDSDGLRDYWEALKAVLADLDVTGDEYHFLAEKKRALRIPQEQVRALHARVFLSVLKQFTTDTWLDEREGETLAKLHRCLSKLGWAPGESTQPNAVKWASHDMRGTGRTRRPGTSAACKQICFTGTFASPRKALTQMAESNGLRVAHSVTKRLHYLCIGESPGPTKLDRAREQGVVIVTEGQFKDMFSSDRGNTEG